LDVESLPLCSEADLFALGIPTGPRLKLMAHFSIPRADGSRMGLHSTAPPSPSAEDPSEVLLGLQNEVARLVVAVDAMQKSSGGLGDALVRVEAHTRELQAQQRELLARQVNLAKRHANLHAAVLRAPADEGGGGDEEESDVGGFETGRYEDEDEEALSEYVAVGRGFAHEVANHDAAEAQSRASSLHRRSGEEHARPSEEEEGEAYEVVLTQGNDGDRGCSASVSRDCLEYEDEDNEDR
jgi:hypothetical protein